MRITYALFLCIVCGLRVQAQIDFTANDQVPAYNGAFGYGSNMGYYPGWSDEELANIAAGNKNLGIPGVGVNTLRPWLPEWFLEQWGYDIRKNTFQHYKNLGIINTTVFIGYPAEVSREEIEHCPGHRSPLFKNMWAPIWDEGQNGTPINEGNPYALYVYKMVQQYKFNVKFWEILNEPDFDHVGNSSLPKDDPNSWWNTNPDPCESGLRAPISYYIRMLRISYEVIKYLDPDAYVSIAGLGYPSFLDAVLRQTDNPDNGLVTEAYPLKGGAYFDVMCYHAYPHFDGSMRYWSNAAGGFVYTRHSDAAADGVANKKDVFDEVLKSYGYDGLNFPEKKWIITESNIPRKAFGEYIGSDEAQRNFTIKTLIQCQKKDILQYHIFSLAESNSFEAANYEFELMGLYKTLEGINKYQQQATDQGIAYQTTSHILKDHSFDAGRTTALNLPVEIDGAAFISETGNYTYVLWAKTTTDRSENAAIKFSIPNQFRNGNFEVRQWDFGRTNIAGAISGINIQLSATPIFISEPQLPLSNAEINDLPRFSLKSFPNPARNKTEIQFFLKENSYCSITVMDINGRTQFELLKNLTLHSGLHRVPLDLSGFISGLYVIKLNVEDRTAIIKFVKQ